MELWFGLGIQSKKKISIYIIFCVLTVNVNFYRVKSTTIYKLVLRILSVNVIKILVKQHRGLAKYMIYIFMNLNRNFLVNF